MAHQIGALRPTGALWPFWRPLELEEIAVANNYKTISYSVRLRIPVASNAADSHSKACADVVAYWYVAARQCF